MRVLVVRLSSMGDIIQTLPALTDAATAYPHIKFDWLVEENFQEIPAWHPHVNQVIPVALRRWRKNIISSIKTRVWKKSFEQLKAQTYDHIIDAQGLIKSALLTRIAKGQRHGYDKNSARESLASSFYKTTHRVARTHSSMMRHRHLFAQALNYEIPTIGAQYGITQTQFNNTLPTLSSPYVVFLHGTTWASKHWPESSWYQLSHYATKQGLKIVLPWGNEIEKARAERIKAQNDACIILDKMSLTDLAGVLAHAWGVVSVDTGLGHLTGALRTPIVFLYGPTNHRLLSGDYGSTHRDLYSKFPCAPCAERVCPIVTLTQDDPPCFNELTPEYVWGQLSEVRSHAILD